LISVGAACWAFAEPAAATAQSKPSARALDLIPVSFLRRIATIYGA
jgi:hypothetical protein